MKVQPNPILPGNKYNRLTVVELITKGKKNKYNYWLCECDCGVKTQVRSSHLRAGTIKSCGCLLREKLFKHGYAKTPTHSSWDHMVRRCNDPKYNRYHDYGGRGITVCERWLDFKAFLADMGERPKDKSIDRIDNSKGYFPENCKWSTRKEQMQNRRPQRKRASWTPFNEENNETKIQKQSD